MMSPRAGAVVRRGTSLLAVTVLLLFQLLSRADLARAEKAEHGPGLLCASVDGGTGTPFPDTHAACAIMCAMICHSQILPPLLVLHVERFSQTIAPRRGLNEAGLARASVQCLRIRGPPDAGRA